MVITIPFGQGQSILSTPAPRSLTATRERLGTCRHRGGGLVARTINAQLLSSFTPILTILYPPLTANLIDITHHGGSRRDRRESVRLLLVPWCISTEPRLCSQSRALWRRFWERGWERVSQGQGYEAKTVRTLNCASVVSLIEHLILRSKKRRNSGGPEGPVQDSPLRYDSHPTANRFSHF